MPQANPAFNEGMKAGREGKKAKDNPYKSDPERKLWKSGRSLGAERKRVEAE